MAQPTRTKHAGNRLGGHTPADESERQAIAEWFARPTQDSDLFYDAISKLARWYHEPKSEIAGQLGTSDLGGYKREALPKDLNRVTHMVDALALKHPDKPLPGAKERIKELYEKEAPMSQKERKTYRQERLVSTENPKIGAGRW